MFFKRLRGLFSNDLSIDLGTANTLIYVRGNGQPRQMGDLFDVGMLQTHGIE